MTTASMHSHRARPRPRPTAGAGAAAHAGRGLGAVRPRRRQRAVPLLRPGAGGDDYAWSIKPPVNAAFIGAGFLAGHARDRAGAARTRPAGARSRRCRSRCGCSRRSLLAATIIHNDRFKFDYAPTWVWTFVYARRAARDPVPRLRASARTRTPSRAADPRLTPAARRRRVFGVAHPGRRDRAVRRPRRPRRALAVAADAAARPRRRRLVRAVRDDAGQLRDRHAPPGRRDHPLRDARLLERAAAAAARCCTPSDVSGGGLWYALMVALLALSGLRAAASAWPDRRKTSRRRRRWPRRGGRASAPSAARASSPRDRRAETPAPASSARARPRPTAPGSPCGIPARGGRGGGGGHLAVLGRRRSACGLNGQDTRREDGHKGAETPCPRRASLAEPWNASAPPATTAATVAAARHSR